MRGASGRIRPRNNKAPVETRVVGGGKHLPNLEALGKMLPNSRGRLGAHRQTV